jgi:hypothetical protein
MNRSLTYLIGPESVLTLSTICLFWFCARHNSGEGRDVELMERLIWSLPFLLTSLSFSTIAVPGSINGWWLGRAIVFTFIAALICSSRLIDGLGSGPKGQDVAFILTIALGATAIAIATATTGAMILANANPSFATWFKAHKVLGVFLTLLSAFPIGFVLGFAVTAIVAVTLGFYFEVLKR